MKPLPILLAACTLLAAPGSSARAQMCPFGMRWQVQMQWQMNMQQRYQMQQQMLYDQMMQRQMQQQMHQQMLLSQRMSMQRTVNPGQLMAHTVRYNTNHTVPHWHPTVNLHVGLHPHITHQVHPVTLTGHGPGHRPPAPRHEIAVHYTPHVRLTANLRRSTTTHSVSHERRLVARRPSTEHHTAQLRSSAKPQQRAAATPASRYATRPRPQTTVKRQDHHRPSLQVRVRVQMTCGSCHFPGPRGPSVVAQQPRLQFPTVAGRLPRPTIVAIPGQPGLARLPTGGPGLAGTPKGPRGGPAQPRGGLDKPVALVRPPALPPLRQVPTSSRTLQAPSAAETVRSPGLEKSVASAARPSDADAPDGKYRRPPELPPLEGTMVELAAGKPTAPGPLPRVSNSEEETLGPEELAAAPPLPPLPDVMPPPARTPAPVPARTESPVEVVLRAPALPPLP
jgi:hypothetical protein